MATQLYDITQINKQVTNIRAQNEELAKTIQAMENIVRDLSSVWKDAAQTKFVQQFEELKPELDSFCKNITNFADRAEAHAKNVHKVSNGPV